MVLVWNFVAQVPMTAKLIQQVLGYLPSLAGKDVVLVIPIFVSLAIQYSTVITPRMDEVFDIGVYPK